MLPIYKTLLKKKKKKALSGLIVINVKNMTRQGMKSLPGSKSARKQPSSRLGLFRPFKI